MSKVRGAGRLAIEATTSVMELVEEMHRTIASGPAVLGTPLERPAKFVTGAVYGTIRGVTQLVGDGIDAALAQLAPLLGDSTQYDNHAVVSALNGVLGEYLRETNNPLAITMTLRQRSPTTTRKVVVLIHGSSMNDLQWNRNGHDHGAALANDFGFTPMYAHYNSGLHVSTNGHELSSLLEKLPESVEEIVLIGHSMGGLVARAACHAGEHTTWRRKLRRLITLGTPHHGAPLERAGNWFELMLGVSRYSAPFARLGKLRSAGVTDLRFGNVLDQHWQGRDRFAFGGDSRVPLPLPLDVTCHAIAASLSEKESGKQRGDGLVPVDSALGRHARAEHTLTFAPENQWVGYGMGHLDLLDRRDVYEQLRAWFSA